MPNALIRLGIAVAPYAAFIVACAAFSTPADAQWRHHHRYGGYGYYGYGPGLGFATGLAIGSAPYYAYGGGCYFRRHVVIDSRGHRHLRRVRICD